MLSSVGESKPSKRGIAEVETSPVSVEVNQQRVQAVAGSSIDGMITRAKRVRIQKEKEVRVSIEELQKNFTILIERASSYGVSKTLLKQLKRSHAQMKGPRLLGSSLEKVLDKGEIVYKELSFLFAHQIRLDIRKGFEKSRKCIRRSITLAGMIDGLGKSQGLLDRLKVVSGKAHARFAALQEYEGTYTDLSLIRKYIEAKRAIAYFDQMTMELDKICSTCRGLRDVRAVAKAPSKVGYHDEFEVKLKVLRQDIKLNPVKYLLISAKALSAAIEHQTMRNIRFRIEFEGEVGQDEGGLTQEFFRLLFTSLCTNAEGKRRSLFELNEYNSEAENIYTPIGFLLRYVYERSALKIGRCIDARDMRLLFGFSVESITMCVGRCSPFLWQAKDQVVEEFTKEASGIRGVCDAVLATKEPSERNSFMHLSAALAEEDPTKVSPQMLESVAANDDVMDEYGLEDDDDLKGLLNTDSTRFQEVVQNSAVSSLAGAMKPYNEVIPKVHTAFCFTPKWQDDRLKNAYSGGRLEKAKLAAIDTHYIEGVESVSAKIQGESDRKAVLNRMRATGLMTTVLSQKLYWFRRWVLGNGTDEVPIATEKEWSAFLIFVTGANCDSSGIVFEGVANGMPLLKAHTCFTTVEINSAFVVGIDDTYERFIGKLKESIGCKGFSDM